MGLLHLWKLPYPESYTSPAFIRVSVLFAIESPLFKSKPSNLNHNFLLFHVLFHVTLHYDYHVPHRNESIITLGPVKDVQRCCDGCPVQLSVIFEILARDFRRDPYKGPLIPLPHITLIQALYTPYITR